MSKQKKYLILDTETATLPYANQACRNAKQKQMVAIAKPLIYDIGWTVCTATKVLVRKNFLIAETYGVPAVFNTAYYKDKKDLYVEKIQRKEIKIVSWCEALAELEKDLQDVCLVGAFNATFDFKKAIPFTIRYMNALYGNYFEDWEGRQRKSIDNMLSGEKPKNNPDFLTPSFEINGKYYPLVDLWGLACDRLINNERYKRYCMKNALFTNSKEFFKTNAECCFQYLAKQYGFIEEHTALADAEIETVILQKALKKGSVKPRIKEFPYRLLGTTLDFVTKYPKYAPILHNEYEIYLQQCIADNKSSRWLSSVTNNMAMVENLL